MRRVKVTSYQNPSRGLGGRYHFLRLLDLCSMLIRGLLPLLPFIVIGALFLLPKTPYLRVSYTYTGSYEHPRYISCRYLGIHGWHTVYGNHCPMVTLMNGAPFRQESLRRPDESHQFVRQGHRGTG